MGYRFVLDTHNNQQDCMFRLFNIYIYIYLFIYVYCKSRILIFYVSASLLYNCRVGVRYADIDINIWFIHSNK